MTEGSYSGFSWRQRDHRVQENMGTLPRICVGPFRDVAERDAVIDALRGWACAETFPTHRQLLRSLATQCSAIVILALESGGGTDVRRVTSGIRRSCPQVLLVHCAAMRPGLGRAICEAVAGGAEHVIFVDDRLRDELQALAQDAGLRR
jgi:hypothetical protein